MHHKSNIAITAVLLALAVSLSGCATNKTNWNSLIGKVTYDEAVVDMGPPDRQAKLQNGTIVAEWITRRATHTTFVSGYYGGGYYYPHAWYGPVGPTYIDSYSPDFFLRLTFGPDGKLQSWKKLRR